MRWMRTLVALLLATSCVSAFDAGNVPPASALEGKAFRHGDIEDTLRDLRRRPKKHFWNFEEKFNSLDTERVYFGNWLRDYSQVIDVGTLSRHLPREALTLVVALLSFKETHFVTDEFQVTQKRLGVYRAEEHVDNPKGYPLDARTYDDELRGPIDPRELEVDGKTGLRNYMANEKGNWTTSSASIRKTLTRAIQGYRAGNETDGLRLLGQALHTLEDYSAHTNYVELTLAELGYRHVFPYIGELAPIKYDFMPAESGVWETVRDWLPDWLSSSAKRAGCYRPIYPITTGTFGQWDLAHSLLGEIKDKIGSLEIQSLMKEMKQEAHLHRRDPLSTLTTLIGLLRKLTHFDEEMESIIDDIEKTLSDFTHPLKISLNDGLTDEEREVLARLWRLLELRDRIMKKVSAIIDRIPGFRWLQQEVSILFQRIIYSFIEPLATPLLIETVEVLQKLSDMVTAAPDQQEIFTSFNATDPTHSIISKDHFDLHLNEPAGLVAKVIVEHVANAVVTAWFDPSPAALDDAVNIALQVFHHPSSLLTPKKTRLQKDMFSAIKSWASAHPAAIAALDKDSVRAGWHRRVKPMELSCANAQKDLSVGVGYGWVCGDGINQGNPPPLPPLRVPQESGFRRCEGVGGPVLPTTSSVVRTTTSSVTVATHTTAINSTQKTTIPTSLGMTTAIITTKPHIFSTPTQHSTTRTPAITLRTTSAAAPSKTTMSPTGSVTKTIMLASSTTTLTRSPTRTKPPATVTATLSRTSFRRRNHRS
ncbi:heterokaryon incompatibility protein Het-C-domain-containing protein [Fimicolochytrium jonesii]|uniref:heterokaryon incompatibility protein Het-C-domain-containing protein n=1 Tax=Fimicolochytrium jonesii TaxID=1396493 RepID=UPI0022FE59DB|nr:heterokaryon incompatibility protein Het-C-domain-containing protein [Fimicolochytrium jonesii]KAI8817208.1 heterokaryon incompatibility protein Het-C-domain-containing protein [Fimicolochytrium jonesii]